MENENKARIVFLYMLLNEMTDEDHPLSTVEIINLLKEKYGVQAHRTTLSRDIGVLEQCGVDVITINSTQNKYFIGSRLFELPELKLLIDAVESSKFITEVKSKELVAKLSKLASVNQAESLKRNLCTTNRIKPGNEMVYYIVDAINEAINHHKKISFQYFEYDARKQQKLKNGGKDYVFSPYTLAWNGDYYYVVGFSEKHQKIGAFRVDRIKKKPTILNDEAVSAPADFNIVDFTKSVFGMYDSERTIVELRCDNSLMKTMIDRFGEDVSTKPYSMTEFKATVEVSASPTFYGWVFGFSGKIGIISPKEIKEAYKDQLKQVLNGLEESK
ncbi:MAG: WYL domain-containing protein [Paludibacter sp.]|nr:WYL domain-containing protein [Paludibacter sp.]